MARNLFPPLTTALLLVAIFTTLLTSLTMAQSSPNIIAGLRIYKKIADSNVGKNLLMSPVSISMAMRMVYLGANGATKSQIEEAMRLSQDERKDFKYITFFMLGDYDTVEKYTPLSPRYSLLMANRLYGPTGYTFKDDYVKTIRNDYGIKFKGLNFKKDADRARRIMNNWVRNKTLSKVPELFPEGSIHNDSTLVLASALALRSSWLYKFDEKDTKPQTFHLSNGTEIKVPMMECGPHFEHLYVNNSRFQVLKLYFKGHRETMYFVLPHHNQTLTSVENLLETTGEPDLLSGFESTYLKASIPKFALELALDLKEPLTSVGIHDAFDEIYQEACRGCFSRISDSGKLVLSKVMHKSYLKVDERGTGFETRPGFPCEKEKSTSKPVDFTLDRPFIFIVLDESTRSVIFRGRVLNPLEVK